MESIQWFDMNGSADLIWYQTKYQPEYNPGDGVMVLNDDGSKYYFGHVIEQIGSDLLVSPNHNGYAQVQNIPEIVHRFLSSDYKLENTSDA